MTNRKPNSTTEIVELPHALSAVLAKKKEIA